MSSYPNIYAAVVFDLHPKIKSYIDRLNTTGQIDLDPHGYPYLISCNKNGANYDVQIARNGNLEKFVMNPRRKVEPHITWNPNDGFQRPQQKKVSVMKSDGQPDRRERARRPISAAVESIIESIMKDN